MKIKTDFVTNSSSSSYILGFKNSNDLSDFEDFIELHLVESCGDEMGYIDTIFYQLQELQDYTNGHEYDWASTPRGINFLLFDEGVYLKLKNVIDKKYIAVHFIVDYSDNQKFVSSEFRNSIFYDLG